MTYTNPEPPTPADLDDLADRLRRDDTAEGRALHDLARRALALALPGGRILPTGGGCEVYALPVDLGDPDVYVPVVAWITDHEDAAVDTLGPYAVTVAPIHPQNPPEGEGLFWQADWSEDLTREAGPVALHDLPGTVARLADDLAVQLARAD